MVNATEMFRRNAAHGARLGFSLALLSCGQSSITTTHDAAMGMDVAGVGCIARMRPDPCVGDEYLCIEDFRSQKPKFPTCFAGFDRPAWLNPFVVSCGRYDALVFRGIDSAHSYYFDRSDGHLVGVSNTGVTTLPFCEAFDPSFDEEAPCHCNAVEECLRGDGGPDATFD